MSRMLLTHSVVVLLVAAAISQADDPSKQKDPPKKLEGTIKKLESDKDKEKYLIVTVKEKQPTEMEDVLVDVDKDHRFHVTGATRVVGVDGKPAKKGLEALEPNHQVRVEFTKDRVIEVKLLPKNSKTSGG